MPDATSDYPQWTYYPQRERPPAWVSDFARVVRDRQESIDSRIKDGMTSDKVLAELRPGLEALEYEVERGKKADEKIRRPDGDPGR